MLNDPLLRFVYKYIRVMWTEDSESKLNLLVCEDIKNSLFSSPHMETVRWAIKLHPDYFIDKAGFCLQATGGI